MRSPRIAGLLASAALGISACALDEPAYRDVTPEEFRSVYGCAIPFYPLENSDVSESSGVELLVYDEDGDGSTDVMTSMGNAHWVAKDFDTRRYVMKERGRRGTHVMTPEIREAATQSLKADQHLAYLMAKRLYELERENLDEQNKNE